MKTEQDHKVAVPEQVGEWAPALEARVAVQVQEWVAVQAGVALALFAGQRKP